jgi:catechol 2,3-dioxygenase-like lactoylglutathione lyase family enzyme
MFTFGRVAPSIPVTDMSSALGFYRDLLGFAVTFTNGDPVSFAVIEQGDAQLHLIVQPSRTGVFHEHIMVDELDSLYKHLQQAKVTIRQTPKLQEWGLRDMIIVDPDGNTFEIAEPANDEASV